MISWIIDAFLAMSALIAERESSLFLVDSNTSRKSIKSYAAFAVVYSLLLLSDGSRILIVSLLVAKACLSWMKDSAITWKWVTPILLSKVGFLLNLLAVVLPVLFASDFMALWPVLAAWKLNPVFLAYLLAYLICLSPSNYLITWLLSRRVHAFDFHDKNNQAGRLIGSLERIIILSLVLIGEFEAVGLVVAAKTIIRIEAVSGREGDNPKIKLTSEIVLLGTLMSLCIAGGLRFLLSKITPLLS